MKKVDIWNEEKRIKPSSCMEDDTFGRRYDGGSCPFCGSRNIMATEQVQMDGSEGTQEIECHDCGQSWYDIVELRGWMEEI